MSITDLLTGGWIVIACAAGVASLPGSLELLFLSLGAFGRGARTRAYSTSKVCKNAAARRLKLAAVIPAHNEAAGIGGCVLNVLAAQRQNLDLTVVVIADNCSDTTAEIAHKAGACVIVRTNDQLRGKGYALDEVFRSLLPEGFDAFAVIDADTEIDPEFFTKVVNRINAGAEALQARYLVRNPHASARTRLMNVALLAFNVLRPMGRSGWGLSAGIYGNGFILSAATLKAVPYGAASVVEDLEYHLALVRAGVRVEFARETAVYGEIPAAGKGVRTQRTRWEGGRFRMLREQGPRLAREVLAGKLRMLEPLLDLLLLPLAFHVALLLIAISGPSTVTRLAGAAGLLIVVFHLAAALLRCGGTWRDVLALTSAPFYIAWKLLLLPALLRNAKSGTAWVRTERAVEKKVP